MRFTLTRLLAALAALTMTVTAPAWAENGSNKLQDYLNRTQSLSARFHQQLLDEDRIELQQSKGSVLIERPMRFRWDYVEPFPQLIVTNGERFWLYDSELKQVTIRPVDQALGRSPAMVLSTDKPLDEEFDITDIGEVRGYYWIDLKPKSKDTDFDKVRIGLRDDDLEIMELYDGLGQITRLTFTNVELNPDIAQGRFQFVPPPGVDVIDSTK